MRIGAIRSSKIKTFEEFQAKIEGTVAELNETKDAHCWVCGELVRKWGVLFPENPDGLGLGSSVGENGKPNTRIAFFPFCKHHDLENEEVERKVRARLKGLQQELTN